MIDIIYYIAPVRRFLGLLADHLLPSLLKESVYGAHTFLFTDVCQSSLGNSGFDHLLLFLIGHKEKVGIFLSAAVPFGNIAALFSPLCLGVFFFYIRAFFKIQLYKLMALCIFNINLQFLQIILGKRCPPSVSLERVFPGRRNKI